MKLFTLIFAILAFYLINVFVKFLYCTVKINRGNTLISQLELLSNHRDALDRLYPQIKMYCSQVGIMRLQNLCSSDNTVNLLNTVVQKSVRSSLNKAVGCHMLNRRYCYILFSVFEYEKRSARRKCAVDCLAKAGLSIALNLIASFIFKIIGQ